ncbi:MAG: response regulator transcription factor [Caldilineaceae bacterium]
MSKSLELTKSKSQKLLVVDATLAERVRLSVRLQLEGFIVCTAANMAEAVAIVQQEGLPHLALIDIDLLGKDGLTLASELRRSEQIPLIFMVGATNLRMLKKGLEDLTNYQIITRPLGTAELLAAVYDALHLDQMIHVEDNELTIDEQLRVNFAREHIYLNDRLIKLSPIENRLLYALYCHRGQLLSPEMLLSKIWKPKHKQSKCSLWAHMSRLRDKLESSARQTPYISTVRGKGYTLCADGKFQMVEPLLSD